MPLTLLHPSLCCIATPIDYYTALVELFKKAKRLHKGKTIFITLGCLNERLDTDLNKNVVPFNEAAKKAAVEESIIVADVHPSFVKHLATRVQTDYLIESFLGGYYFR